MTELSRWYKDIMQPSKAFLKFCRRLLKLSQPCHHDTLTATVDKVLKQPQGWCDDLDQVASTSDDSFKTKAIPEA